MSVIARSVAACIALAACAAALADAPAARQDPEALRAAAQQFLAAQTAGIPGQATIKTGPVDPHLKLAACKALQAFFPAGSRAWGRTTVGVRCTEPVQWTIYVPANVHVAGSYIVTTHPLAQGQTIAPQDIVTMNGDLSALPSGVVTDAQQAVGHVMLMSMASGMPLRQDALRGQQAVKQGQVVKLITNGPGFRISNEARALTNAEEGQRAQARTSGGQVVGGIARAGGVIEVDF